MARILIYAGLALLVVGIIAMLADRVGIKFGRLPGDIVYQGKNTTVYFPIVTCIVLSLVLTVLSWLFGRR